jgi:hypothetical protein
MSSRRRHSRGRMVIAVAGMNMSATGTAIDTSIAVRTLAPDHRAESNATRMRHTIGLAPAHPLIQARQLAPAHRQTEFRRTDYSFAHAPPWPRATSPNTLELSA